VKVGRHGGIKSKRINVWNFSLGIGEKAEKIVEEQLNSFIRKITLKRFDYSLFPEIQMAGIDVECKFEEATYEIKGRLSFADKYGDVLLELKTGNKQGWFYTSQADYVAYVIFNDQKTDLLKGYLIAIQNPKLRQFIEEHLNTYPHKIAKSERNGSEWDTENIAIPIQDFPTGTLFPFITPEGKRWGTNMKLNGFCKGDQE